MSLEGKIVDFGVADILQLISQQQKTGVLLVERGDEKIEVLFWNGMIISAHTVAKDDKDLLGERLVRSGLLNDAQLQRALSIQQKNRQHIGEILVEMNLISKEMLDRIIHNQIYDTFSDLLGWKEGSYVFQHTPVNFNEKLFTPLGFEHIILDVLRMMDEWPLLLESISSLDAVFKKTESQTCKKEAESMLLPDQKIIFNLLDGRLSAGELAERSMLGKFATVQALRALLDRELIEPVEKENLLASTARNWQQIVGMRLSAVAGYTVLILIAIGISSLSHSDYKTYYRQLLPKTLIRMTADTFEPIKRLKIKNALQVYLWENGRYPDSLEALVKSGLLAEKEIQGISGAPIATIIKNTPSP